MILLKKTEIVDYKLTMDKDETNPVTFKLRKMSSIDEVLLFDKARADKMDNTETSFLYAQKSIVGIENLKDEDGEVEFEKELGKDYISSEMLGRIPAEILSELTYECAVLGGLVASEKK